MATTWIKPLHRLNGRGIAAALDKSADYTLNPDKTEDGELIVSYGCQPQTAQAEFLLSKKLYAQKTGRDQGKHDVIAYHVRMSFKKGEVTAEKALELGRELAIRWTRGRHQLIIAAHTNTDNPHVHIIFNSVTLDCDRKYQDFKHSYRALRRVSDKICLEHGLAVIEKPGLSKGHNREEYLSARDGGGSGGSGKPPSIRDSLREIIDLQLAQAISAQSKTASFDAFITAMKNAGCEVKRGKHLAFKTPDGQRFIRCSSLGDDYLESALMERLSGKRVVEPKKKASTSPAARTHSQPVQAAMKKPNLLIDIQAKLQQAHSPGFERFARLYNLKEMSKTLLLLQDWGIDSYDALSERADAATKSFNRCSGRVKEIEARQKEISELQKQIGTYSKTKDILAEHNRLKSIKPTTFAKLTNAKSPAEAYYAENEPAIIRCMAAKRFFDEQGYGGAAGKKLPTIKALQAEYAELETERKKLWSGHKAEREEMISLKMAKQNVDMFIGEPRQPKRTHEHDVR